MKKIIILMLVLILATNTFASSQEDTFWDGYVQIGLDKKEFNPDENISGWIILFNDEYIPMFENTIIVQLNHGEPSYPSQFAKDNIVDEIVVKESWVLPRKSRRINFSFKPHASGRYHIDVYSWAMKSMLNGADSILISPRTIKFNVTGNKIRRDIFIEREFSTFEDVAGPVGFPITPGDDFQGKIILKNNEEQNAKNLKLKMSICDWSCNLEEAIFTKEINEINIDAKSESIIDVTLTAPKIPSAYEIKMELFDGEVLLSHYKNRVIATGGTAKFRKIFLSGIKDKISVSSIMSGSPDHFTYPDFENFQVEISVYNENEEIETQQENYSIIKFGDILDSSFNINSEIFDEICLRVKKDNLIYEEECLTTPILKAQEEYKSLFPNLINVEYEYLENNNLLQVNLEKEEGIHAVLRIIKNGTIIYDTTIKDVKTIKKNITLEPGQYILMIDDISAKRQIVEELDLGNTLSEVTASEITDDDLICTGQICEIGTVCDSTPYFSKDGKCCTSKCIPQGEIDGIDLFGIIPLILWISILLLIVGILIFRNGLSKMGGKK